MKPIQRDHLRMNKTEQKYAAHLYDLYESRGIVRYDFEPFGLRLAEEKCYYHPDFLVTYPDRFEIHEVKAFDRSRKRPRVEDDAMVKFKVASALFDFWVFRMVWFDTDKKEWDSKVYKPGA